MHHYTMIASLSNLLCHIHNQNNTSPSYFRVCEVTDIPEIVFLITHIPLIQIMYARVTRPLEQRAGRAIYSKGRLRQTTTVVPPILLEGECLVNVTKQKYLGITINSS